MYSKFDSSKRLNKREFNFICDKLINTDCPIKDISSEIGVSYMTVYNIYNKLTHFSETSNMNFKKRRQGRRK